MVPVAFGALLLAIGILEAPGPAVAPGVGDVFRRVNPSVVVIRSKGRGVESARGLTRFNETGSGVLISADGKVMTAATWLTSHRAG